MAKTFKVNINGRDYPSTEWMTLEQPRTIEKVFDQGFTGGLNAYLVDDDRPDSYYMSVGFDTSCYPWARLEPRRTYVSNGLTNTPNRTLPMYTFLTKDASNNLYTYMVNSAHIWKFFLGVANPTVPLLVEERTFAGGQAGRPALYEGKWYVPFGDGAVNVRRLDTVTIDTDGLGAADTWTDTTFKALHLATFQDGPFASLARAHTTNIVDIATDAPTGAGSFGADFEVGDSTFGINDLLPHTGELTVIKPDGPYRFDPSGTSYLLQEFVAKSGAKTGSPTDGANSASHGPFVFWPHSTGLWRLVGNSMAPVGPDADPRRTEVVLETISHLTSGNWLSVTAWGRWLYATNANDRLFYGYIEDDGRVVWHGTPLPVLVATATRCHLSDGPNGPILWKLTASNVIEATPLDPDGAPDRTLDQHRGRASAEYDLYTPIWVPTPGKQVQLRYVWAIMEGTTTNVTWNIGALRNGVGAAQLLGASITTTGLHERSTTPGTNDLAYEIMGMAQAITTAGYAPATGDPRLRAFGIVVATPTIYRTRITLGGPNLNRSARDALRALRNLKSGAGVAIREPEFNTTFTGYIVDVVERADREQAEASVNYTVDVIISRWSVV